MSHTITLADGDEIKDATPEEELMAMLPIFATGGYPFVPLWLHLYVRPVGPSDSRPGHYLYTYGWWVLVPEGTVEEGRGELHMEERIDLLAWLVSLHAVFLTLADDADDAYLADTTHLAICIPDEMAVNVLLHLHRWADELIPIAKSPDIRALLIDLPTMLYSGRKEVKFVLTAANRVAALAERLIDPSACYTYQPGLLRKGVVSSYTYLVRPERKGTTH